MEWKSRPQFVGITISRQEASQDQRFNLARNPTVLSQLLTPLVPVVCSEMKAFHRASLNEKGQKEHSNPGSIRQGL